VPFRLTLPTPYPRRVVQARRIPNPRIGAADGHACWITVDDVIGPWPKKAGFALDDLPLRFYAKSFSGDLRSR